MAVSKGLFLVRISFKVFQSSTDRVVFANKQYFTYESKDILMTLAYSLSGPPISKSTHIYIWPRLCACAVLTVLQMTTYRVNMLHSPPDPTWLAAQIM